jgi:hypothetical protein
LRVCATILLCSIAIVAAAAPAQLAAQAAPAGPGLGVPAALLPLAAPTGAADLAIMAIWIDDTPTLYGFAFRGGRPARPWQLQVALGQARGAGQRRVGGLSVEQAWSIVQQPGGQARIVTGAQYFTDRRDATTFVRVPLGVRGEAPRLFGAVIAAPVAAAGVAAGATRFERGWTEYVGTFAEAGLRLDVHGAWAQGTILFDRQLSGGAGRTSDPRFVLRFGFLPRTPED